MDANNSGKVDFTGRRPINKILKNSLLRHWTEKKSFRESDSSNRSSYSTWMGMAW
jgi:hypothetical protein